MYARDNMQRGINYENLPLRAFIAVCSLFRNLVKQLDDDAVII